MAKVFAAFADGWGRVLRAPAILFGVVAVTWLVAFPAWRMRGLVGLDNAFYVVWSPVAGFWPAYTPTLLGMEWFVRDVRGFLVNGRLGAELVAAAATTLLVWTFLLGGILDRYARRRPTRAQAFFGTSGVCFFRFLRLGVVAAIGYFVLFGVVHPLFFPPDILWVSGGRAAVASPLQTPGWAVFLMFAAFWSAVVDYARIRAVVEDRRSMLGAILAGWRFITAHPLQTFGLYLLNAAALGALLWITPWIFTSRSDLRMAAFGPVGVHLFGRVALRLVFFASQTALFQRSLAHAEYTAAPALLWPESPAAEEIINAAPRPDQTPR